MTSPPHQPLGWIGRYQLLARLGAGGMGEVFLAKTTGAAGFEKRVVIKRILPHLSKNDAFVTRFLNEAKLVVQLRHAGIAQILDMGEDAGVYFMAMEYVEGRDLRELLRLGRAGMVKPAFSVAAFILMRILEALDHAHRAKDSSGRPLGVIHRDVSPSNVMISRSGEVKLVDFGIARAADRSGLSVSGVLQGKYAYMSPQQAAGGELDPRSDQFSVGVLAWELLAGERPFDGDTDLETLDRIRHHQPGSLAQVVSDVPQPLVEVIDRLLSKDAEGRFENAAAAAKAIQNVLFETSEMVGPRDLQAYYERCLLTLPETQRDVIGQALSLNDALNLHLASDPGVTSQTATGTLSVAAPVSSPSVSRPPEQATPTGSPGLELGPERIPSQADIIAVARGRSRWMSLLVMLNFALLIAVGALVIDRFADKPAEVRQSATFSEGSDQAQAIEASVSSPEVTERAVEVNASPTKATDAEGRAPILAKPRPTPPPEKGINELDRSETAHDVELRTVPPKASIFYEGKLLGASPQTLKLATGERRTLTVSASGHATRQVLIEGGKRDLVRVSLKALGQGRVKLRYFPASASVRLDGKLISDASTNRVDRIIEVGSHRLTISDERGRSKTVRFEVTKGKTTNLATISLDGSANSP